MRYLHVLRHAKSSWDDSGVGDLQRPLAPRGVKAAKLLAAHLHRSRVAPSLVLCSPSRRTRETLELILPGLIGHPEVVIDDDLYAASVEELLDVLRGVDPSVTSVMLIGHNPGLQELVAHLTPPGGQLAARVAEKFPTGALATLALPDDGWDQLAPRSARLVDFAVPADLR